MQKILTWGITIFIIYSLIEQKFFQKIWHKSNNESTKYLISKAEKNKEDQQFEGNFLEKSLSKIVANLLRTENGRIFFKNFITPANQIIKPEEQIIKLEDFDFMKNYFRINSFEPEVGNKAICGYSVAINYQILSLDNNLIEQGEKIITLGKKTILPGLDSVIVGMTVGQTRHAILPPHYAFFQPKYHKEGIDINSYYKVNVRLDKIIDSIQTTNSDIKIFDDTVAYKMPLICGDQVSFEAKITKLSNGKVVYDSTKSNKKINMHIGERKFPLIFSYSLFNKIPVGNRTVISQGKTFHSFDNNESILSSIDIANEEYFMLELKNISN